MIWNGTEQRACSMFKRITTRFTVKIVNELEIFKIINVENSTNTKNKHIFYHIIDILDIINIKIQNIIL